MSQSTFTDDDLFGEAAAEMRDDVEHHLQLARAELPAPEAIWETDAENVLGVLNGLKSSLNVGDAEAELRQAKKWYTMGERADAFEDAADLAEAIEETEELLDLVRDASEQVADLTSTIPELRSALQDAQDAAETADEDDADDAEEDEDEATTDADAEDEEEEEDEEDEEEE